MKIKDIYKLEIENASSIYLIKEGMFLRAYEKSAMLFNHFKSFKILHKHYKIIDKEMVYLGFPAVFLNKFVEELRLEKPQDYGMFFVINVGAKDYSPLPNFDEWKAKHTILDVRIDVKSISANATTIYKNTTIDFFGVSDQQHIIQKPNHKLHIYKTGFDILVQMFGFVANFKREYKYTIGEKLKEEAFELALNCYKMAQNLKICVEKMIELIYTIRLRIRLLMELKQISINGFAKINTEIEQLYKQITHK